MIRYIIHIVQNKGTGTIKLNLNLKWYTYDTKILIYNQTAKLLVAYNFLMVDCFVCHICNFHDGKVLEFCNCC